MDPGPWSVVLREARMMPFSYIWTGFYIGKSLDPLSQISFMLVCCKTNELAVFVQGLKVSHTISITVLPVYYPQLHLGSLRSVICSIHLCTPKNTHEP